MTTVKITIDDTLPFSDLKMVLSLIRGVSQIEIAEYTGEADRQEYEQLKSAFVNGSKRSMAQHINKFIE